MAVRAEWSNASRARRALFALSAAYWLAILLLIVISLTQAQGGYEAGRILGLYLGPLIIAIVIRMVYVLVSRGRPRPPIWSWWVLVIGAALGVALTFQRAAVDVSERAAR
jgi:chromate transport protein ChrA